MNRKEFILEGNNFSDLDGFYNEVERKLTKDLSWKIGRNLDALNDVLKGGFGAFAFGESTLLTWKNADKSKNDLGWKATEQYIENKLKSCHADSIEHMKKELFLAKEHKGKTFFEIIWDIIKDQRHIELILD